jgi:hypothetical protein
MANEAINEAVSVLIVSTKSNVYVPQVQFRSLHAPSSPSSRLQAICRVWHLISRLVCGLMKTPRWRAAGIEFLLLM